MINRRYRKYLRIEAKVDTAMSFILVAVIFIALGTPDFRSKLSKMMKHKNPAVANVAKAGK